MTIVVRTCGAIGFLCLFGATALSCGGASRASPAVVTAPVVPIVYRPVPLVVGSPRASHGPDIARPEGLCPAETHWDGLACAHVRATCGGWDGAVCVPPDVSSNEAERAARTEFARIDADARVVCTAGEPSTQAFGGPLPLVCDAIKDAIRLADDLSERLAQLRASRRTPHWEVETYARAGSLYDCIWTSARAAPPVVPPQMQLMIARLSFELAAAGQGQQAHQTQVKLAELQQFVADKFTERTRYVTQLEIKMVRSYATAALLARRYALEGFDLTMAGDRLRVVASLVGDGMMTRVLAGMPDPTDAEPDPNMRRHVVYVPDAFGVP